MSEIINSEPTAVGPGGDVQFSWPWPLFTTAWTPVTNGTPAMYVTYVKYPVCSYTQQRGRVIALVFHSLFFLSVCLSVCPYQSEHFERDMLAYELYLLHGSENSFYIPHKPERTSVSLKLTFNFVNLYLKQLLPQLR